MRVLIVSLSSYSSPQNRGKLESLAPRLDGLAVITGAVPTMWEDVKVETVQAEFALHVVPMRFGSSNATRVLRGFDALARAARPDLVHVEAEPWQAVALQAVKFALRADIPVGIHFAEDGPRLAGALGAARRTLSREVLRRCAYAVGWYSGSEAVAHSVAPEVRTRHMPGIGIDRVGPRPGGREDAPNGSSTSGSPGARVRRIAFAGRLHERKGISDVMATCDALSHHLKLAVSIVGGGPEEDAVRTWAARRPWVRIHGELSRNETIECLSRADVVLMPSRTTRNSREQFGRVAVEAMAAGTPVAAYECGALAEVIADGGWCVAQGDLGALTLAVQEFLSLPAPERIEMRTRAWIRAHDFSNERLAEQLIELWTEVRGSHAALSRY